MVHIIGAGVSGLAAATQLSAAHVPVRLYEATANAGGRARSSNDATLGSIDHGLHVMGPEVRELFTYLDRIGARDSLVNISNPNNPPAAPLADYLALLPLFTRRHGTLGDLLADDNRLRDLWAARFAQATLHTKLDRLSLAAARRAVWRTLRSGRRMTRSYTVRDSLHASLIAPALAHLEYQGTSLYFNHALKGLERKAGKVTSLTFARQKIAVGPEDIVILGLPAAATQLLLPEIAAPKSTHSSITLHYRVAHREAPHRFRPLQDAPVDSIRYTAGCISLGIRLANHLWHGDPDLLAERLWRWLQKEHVYLADVAMPDYAIWREKHAGHQLLEDDLPVIPKLPQRLFLAGDWLTPYAPSSIETAIASGHRAATDAMALIKTPLLRTQ